MELVVRGTDILVGGRFFRSASLRHEWFEFLEDPAEIIKAIKEQSIAEIFTFIDDIDAKPRDNGFHRELASAAILRITSSEEWMRNLNFKVRNKIRKSEKEGVVLRPVTLDDAFACGVEAIYNESPIRQGMKFWHYGKTAARIKEDLSSFPNETCFVGAYLQDELVGFMKLFRGNNILRTVHIIAKLSQRDKPIQDALIARAVQICEERKVGYFHYGNWSLGGLGAFKIKHGFERFDVTRYFVPINLRGGAILNLGLHHPLRDRLPPNWRERLVKARARMNSLRYNSKVRLAGRPLG